jgi:RNA polymerase sigma-70 factor (ECF subfamily)
MEQTNSSNSFDELGTIITAFQDQLFRFAFFRTGSLADAQDIVQDVFVTFFKNQQHPSSINNVKHYLFKSISNACTDRRRKKKMQFEPVEKINGSAFPQQEDAAHHLLMTEEYQRIEKLLQHVPQQQAEIIRLRVLDNLSFVEIAGLLDRPVTTVKSGFKYGIDKLKLVLHPKKDLYEL